MRNASNNYYIRSMVGIVFIHVPQIVDGTTLCLHILVSYHCSITFLNPVAI